MGADDMMTQADRIRNYYKDNPLATYTDVENAINVPQRNIRANVTRDLQKGNAIRSEEGGLDYSNYFSKSESQASLMDWKNDNRREWVDMMTEAARQQTDSNLMRLLIKEANKIMKEVME